MKKLLVIHPFLFSIFPILALFAHNIAIIPMEQIITPLVITTIFTLLLFLLLGFLLKDKQKAGLIVSLLFFLFFSYGHFYNLIKDLMLVIKGFFIGPHKILFLSFGLIFLLCIYFCIKTRRRLYNFTNILNVVAVSLVVISSINIGLYKLKTGSIWQNRESVANLEINIMDSKKAANFPNIYYIILDGYAREDILKELYHYDNTKFLNFLIKKGFYIANKSSSNYCQTSLSLASSLNMTYLDTLVKAIGVKNSDRKFVVDMIKKNNTFSFLKKYGYTIVAFSSGYYGTEIKNADIYISSGLGINLFQNELINITLFQVIFSKLVKKTAYGLQRKRILNTFDNLLNISKTKNPFLVFIHIICPHPPFVFGAHGEKITPSYRFKISDGSHLLHWISKDEYIEGYKNQLDFLNKKIIKTIDAIISRSPEPPMIILQADHGPGSMLDWGNAHNTNFNERLSILNAYYLPGDGNKELYPSITPVNTFRVIFNRYFGTNYNLLKDKSYFSTWSQPYKFIDVTYKNLD